MLSAADSGVAFIRLSISVGWSVTWNHGGRGTGRFMCSSEDVLEGSVTDFCRCNEVSASGSNGVVSDPYAEYETRSGEHDHGLLLTLEKDA